MSKFIIKHDDDIKALSFSQMSSFLKCRRQWYYRYKMGLTPRITATSLNVGKLAHVGMAEFWMTKAKDDNDVDTMVEKGVEAIRGEFNNNLILMNDTDLRDAEFETLTGECATAIEVFIRAVHNFNHEAWDVHFLNGFPLVEVRFAIPLAMSVPMQGFIDLVAIEKSTGQVFQIDWKFASSITDNDSEMFNMQNVIYNHALRRMGIEAVGSITFKVLNKPSTTPNINKNGTVSRALIRCTWEEYANFVTSQGLNPDDYADEMIPKLSGVQFTNSIKEYWNPNIVSQIWKNEVVGTAYEILKKNTRYQRTISQMTCRSCQYRSICHAELRGYDTDGIINSEYLSSTYLTEDDDV
jgi:hypothetical protein